MIQYTCFSSVHHRVNSCYFCIWYVLGLSYWAWQPTYTCFLGLRRTSCFIYCGRNDEKRIENDGLQYWQHYFDLTQCNTSIDKMEKYMIVLCVKWKYLCKFIYPKWVPPSPVLFPSGEKEKSKLSVIISNLKNIHVNNNKWESPKSTSPVWTRLIPPQRNGPRCDHRWCTPSPVLAASRPSSLLAHLCTVTPSRICLRFHWRGRSATITGPSFLFMVTWVGYPASTASRPLPSEMRLGPKPCGNLLNNSGLVATQVSGNLLIIKLSMNWITYIPDFIFLILVIVLVYILLGHKMILIVILFWWKFRFGTCIFEKLRKNAKFFIMVFSEKFKD